MDIHIEQSRPLYQNEKLQVKKEHYPHCSVMSEIESTGPIVRTLPHTRCPLTGIQETSRFWLEEHVKRISGYGGYPASRNNTSLVDLWTLRLGKWDQELGKIEGVFHHMTKICLSTRGLPNIYTLSFSSSLLPLYLHIFCTCISLSNCVAVVVGYRFCCPNSSLAIWVKYIAPHLSNITWYPNPKDHKNDMRLMDIYWPKGQSWNE